MRQTATTRETIHLSGKWSVVLNSWTIPGEVIMAEVTLPGTLDEHDLGPMPKMANDRLSRAFAYTGSARYERRVVIPENWRDKSILFSMERTRVTEVSIDGEVVGSRDSLSTPQCYELTGILTPGEHVLAVKVDNDSGVMGWASIRNSHMATDNTQTNWNGILGDIELTAMDAVRIDQIAVQPQDETTLQAHVVLKKPGGQVAALRVVCSILDTDGCELHLEGESLFSLDADQQEAHITVPIQAGKQLLRWDEFQPALYKIRVSLECMHEDRYIADVREASFGWRTFRVEGTQFAVNGRKTFLRGKHDGCVFPLTGYAPMDTEAWLELFRTAKDYGINHYRFHSWCPPKAAFEAADLLGIYLQPELPFWNPGTAFEDDEEWRYFGTEALRILEAYGHHPSFVMFAWGNELSGSEKRMGELVETARGRDAGKLYAIGSNNFFLNARQPRNSDYWTTFWTEGAWNVKKSGYGGKHVRGATPHPTRGHINNSPPSGCKDYREELRDVAIPVIGHEVGQFQIHPDFQELEKYRGVLKPSHLELLHNRAAESGLLTQAANFQAASGRLAALCYREEIEAALRTPGMAGFQLLDLQDFPGQGGAFVGILDSFMDAKGLIAAEQWRSFCSEVVPLVRLGRYTWTAGEQIAAPIEVAHYGPEDLTGVTVSLTITDAMGTAISEGLFADLNLPKGCLSVVGMLVYEIPRDVYAQRWSLRVAIGDTSYSNEYPLWVYPEPRNVSIPSSVFVADAFDEGVKRELRNGRSVLLVPPAGGDFGNGPSGAFIPDFWCYTMFKKYDPPGTLGILCDPSHPALEGFPTAFHAEWQWWHLMKNSRAVVLDKAGPDYRPIVQVIDNVARQHRLGLAFEAKVGDGRLLICSIDLWSQQDRPEARQLLQSLLHYCESERFEPGTEWSETFVERLFSWEAGDEVAGNPDADTFG